MSNDIRFDLNMLEFGVSVSCGSFYWTLCVNVGSIGGIGLDKECFKASDSNEIVGDV